MNPFIHRGVLCSVLSVSALMMIPIKSAADLPKHMVRLSVDGEIEKDRDSDKHNAGKKSTRSETRIQWYELDIQIANLATEDDTLDLEWYFIKRPVKANGDEAEPMIYEKGSRTLSIAARKREKLQLESKPLTYIESKTTTNSNNNNNNRKNSGSSKTTRSYSGDKIEGYIVVVRHSGEILASEASDDDYLTERWLANLKRPIKENRQPSQNNQQQKKKRKKKKK